jgi:predicted exporter
MSVREIQRLAAPGIFWSTVTTCAAFLMLNFGGLPGLGQLGTLVAIGIALAAIVMLYAFLPPLMGKQSAAEPGRAPDIRVGQGYRDIRWPWTSTAMLLAICGVILLVRHPSFDNSPDALRPTKSPAYTAAEQIKQRLQRTQEPLWVLIAGRDEAEVSARLREAEAALSQAVSNGLLTGFTLPTSLWPNPVNQNANRPGAAALIRELPVIRNAILTAGFTTNSLALTENIFSTWRMAVETPGVFWPTNENSQWIMDKLIARNHERILALGLLYQNTNTPLAALTPRLLDLAAGLSPRGIYVSGWEILGYSVFARVKSEFWKVLLPVIVLVTASLWLAFRGFREMLLSFTTLAVSAGCLWTIMGLAGWSWNLLNLMALPLLLGIGVDFSIHIQFALKRYHGDLGVVRGTIGRALLLAGSTTVAGFASLALSNNAGMASLGKVCGTGIICAMLVSVYLLPLWWRALKK